METRALAIAFFYAIGTAVGGITGPYIFGKMIETGEASKVAIAFFIGAGVMALGGIVELLFGVKAEQQALEGIAKPLSAEDAEDEPPPGRRLDRRRRWAEPRSRRRDRLAPPPPRPCEARGADLGPGVPGSPSGVPRGAAGPGRRAW